MSDAGTDKRTFGPILLSNLYGVNIYNNTSFLILDNIQHIHFANRTGSPVTVSIWIGASGANAAGTELFNQYPIPAYGVYDWFGSLELTYLDYIVGGASVSNAVAMFADGVQYPSLGTTIAPTTTTLAPTTTLTTQAPTTTIFPTLPPTTTIPPTITPTILPTTTITTTVCYTNSGSFTLVQSSAANACGAPIQQTLYYTGSQTYTDSGCSSHAAVGYYGDSAGNYYQIVSNALLGPYSCGVPTTTQHPTTTLAPTTTTIPPTTTAAPCYSSSAYVTLQQTSSINACAAGLSITLYFSGINAYSNPTCTTAAANGYYGDGAGNYYTVSSGHYTLNAC